MPARFVLYGGTALALRVAHRSSVDFDFFSHDPLAHQALVSEIPFLSGSTVLHEEPDTLTVSVDRDGPVKISFFGRITFGRIGVPDQVEENGIRVASLIDLAATKLKVLLERVEARDYVDVSALLQAGIRLEDMLGAARTLFGPVFNPLMAQKTLAFFEGIDLESLDEATRVLLTREAVRALDVPLVTKSSERLD